LYICSLNTYYAVSWEYQIIHASDYAFTRESSYCFQRVLAIAIPSVRHTGGSVKNGAS